MLATKIDIFDTTLRDGQQCPGAGMNLEQNLEYARLAALLGVDVLEAGFPSASKLDYDIVRAISDAYAESVTSPKVAALCQLREEQLQVSLDALSPLISTRRARLHTYLPVAPALMEASLGKDAGNKQLLVRKLADFVAEARRAGAEVEFSPEGYSRMGENFDFVTDLILAAVENGATIINCPDTIGGAFRFGPDYFVDSLNRHADIVAKAFPDRNIIWSAHCHNDFGLAVANTMEAVFKGPVRQIEGCLNGVGERAGNAAIEQCVMILKSFGEHSSQKFYSNIRTEMLQRVSDFVSAHMLPRQPHYPVTGENAARHSSGGHTNAVLKNPLAYQPFSPTEVGGEISLIFGPLSGGNHAKSIIERFGYKCADTEKAAVAQYLKDLYSERRKGITDAELLRGYIQYRSPVRIDSFNYSRAGSQVELTIDGKVFDQSGTVHERVVGADSALAALTMLIARSFPGINILRHHSRSLGEGVSAFSQSHILIVRDDGSEFEGVGEDRDIEVSALKAFIDAVNQAWVDRHFRERSPSALPAAPLSIEVETDSPSTDSVVLVPTIQDDGKRGPTLRN